jgi:hypothetical protein
VRKEGCERKKVSIKNDFKITPRFQPFNNPLLFALKRNAFQEVLESRYFGKNC